MLLKALPKVGLFGRDRVVRAPDADSAGAGDVLGVLEVGEVGVRLGDGFGIRG